MFCITNNSRLHPETVVFTATETAYGTNINDKYPFSAHIIERKFLHAIVIGAAKEGELAKVIAEAVPNDPSATDKTFATSGLFGEMDKEAYAFLAIFTPKSEYANLTNQTRLKNGQVATSTRPARVRFWGKAEMGSEILDGIENILKQLGIEGKVLMRDVRNSRDERALDLRFG